MAAQTEMLVSAGPQLGLRPFERVEKSQRHPPPAYLVLSRLPRQLDATPYGELGTLVEWVATVGKSRPEEHDCQSV